MYVNKLLFTRFLVVSIPTLFTLAHSAELSIDSNKPESSTFVQGERVELRFRIEGARAAVPPTLSYKVTDESGKFILPERQQKITLDAQGSGDFVVVVPSDRTGYFEVVAKLDDGTSIQALGTRPAGAYSYAVVVDPNARRDYGDQLSRFGLQGGFNRDVNVIPLLGVRYVFQQSAEWSTAESNGPGQMKKNDDIARAAGAVTLRNKGDPEKLTFEGKKWQTYAIAMLTQGKIPKWAFDPASAGKVGGGANFSAIAQDKEQDFTAFAAEHAREVAFDYPNQLFHFYQVTWEPMYPDGYAGTSAQLVKMYELAYDALHQNDPRAKVAGPTIVLYKASERQLQDLLSVGFTNYIDVFSLHAYEENDKWPLELSGFIEDLRRQVSMVREAAHKQIPFISTEHGFETSKYGLLNQALANIRSSIILLGEGAELVVNFYVADFWNKTPQDGGQSWGFYWNLNPAMKYGSNKLGPKPVAPAYAAMTYILDGSQSRGVIKSLSGSQMGYKFARSDLQIYVIWDFMGSSSVTLNAGTQQMSVCDWMGNCEVKLPHTANSLKLGATPVYVLGNDVSVSR